jgi:Zn ribbon nucleic-acid-binding protein
LLFISYKQGDISLICDYFSMGFQRQCPSCTKNVQIATVEGNYATSHRCEHCGFTIQIPPKENVMRSGDYGD